MKTALSHSRVNRYQMCGKSYEYHYVKKIRPNVTSAALLFGDALDSAFNELLIPSGKYSAKEVFITKWHNGKINNKDEYLPTCTKIVYANSDFDGEILTEEDHQDIHSLAQELEFEIENSLLTFKKIKDEKSAIGFDLLKKEKKIIYNYMNWLSLKRKGLYMIDAYEEEILPKITKVYEVQKKINLANEDGDSVIGYVDLIADVEGYGTVVLDNKTSSRKYSADSVATSPQLSLYMHSLFDEYQTRKAGYLVVYKGLVKNKKKICSSCGHDGTGSRHKTCPEKIDGKRCGGTWDIAVDPKAAIDIIIDDIPEQTENIVMENFDDVNQGIKAELYPRNFQSCSNWYGGDCPYRGLCFKKDMKGLERA